MSKAQYPAPLFPPYRFGTVEENLFRGSYPRQRNHRFLRRLRLRTILSLTPEPASPDLHAFADRHGVTLIHVRVDRPREDVIPLSFARCAAALRVMVDAARLPLAVAEYGRFLGDEDDLIDRKDVVDFVERFAGEVELPAAATAPVVATVD
ncbi:hypothetical protein HK405_002294, partial [Cladochytrium tenue]